MTRLEAIIRQYVQLPNTPTQKGWYAVVCRVCNDYKPRGAFLFTEDSVVYKCFNCNAKTTYFDDSGIITDDMMLTLQSFNIPESSINELILESLSKNKKHKKKNTVQTSIIKPIDMPAHFYKLEKENTDIWSSVANEYLSIERGLTLDDYTFYLSTDKHWSGRLIIPYYFQGNLIYYQGRDLTDSKPTKYKNASIKDTTLLLFGYDKVAIHDTTPLFIVEGFFDALQIGGIAILGNELTKEKIAYINRSNRTKVYVPDTLGNGRNPAIEAVRAGWSISIPDTPGCKDIGEAILKYGKLFVIRSLMDHITSGFEALTNINLHCK
jgi:hypothetical protein